MNDPAVLDGPGPVAEFRTVVEWIDTDAAGIYHNSTVTRFVEAAEARMMAGPHLDEHFHSAPRVRYTVEFEAPLFFGQEVATTLSLKALGTSSMSFAFEVWGEAFNGGPRRRAAHGTYVTVHIDRGHPHAEGARSSPWPDELVARWRTAGEP